jgi:hypothetical protein
MVFLGGNSPDMPFVPSSAPSAQTYLNGTSQVVGYQILNPRPEWRIFASDVPYILGNYDYPVNGEGFGEDQAVRVYGKSAPYAYILTVDQANHH